MTIFDRLKDWWLGTPKTQSLPAPNTQDGIIVIQPAPEPVAVVETQIPVAEPVVAVVAEPVVVAVAEPVVAPVAVVAEPVVEVAKPAKVKKTPKPKAEVVATTKKVSKKKHKS